MIDLAALAVLISWIVYPLPLEEQVTVASGLVIVFAWFFVIRQIFYLLFSPRRHYENQGHPHQD